MIKYIFLGVIQGITEFLPVSSSAHLIFAQAIMGIKEQALAISVVLHLGTSLALIIFFFKDILGLLKNRKLLLFIVLVTLITGTIGLTGKGIFEPMFGSVKLAAGALIITGIILLLTKRIIGADRNKVNTGDALILGLTQGLAIIPGISRSGITVSTLLFRKVSREESFRISFLASIPAVFGAALLEGRKINNAGSLCPGNFIAGFISSLLTGLVALWVFRMIIRRAKLYYFGYYCIFAALVIIFFL